jgi:hypothetical protein
MKTLSVISVGLIINSLLFIHPVTATEQGVVVAAQPAATVKKPIERNYIHKAPQACVNLKLNCDPGQQPFNDKTGCGCLKKLKVIPVKYQTLAIKEAGITIEYPQTWFRQGQNTAWSPNPQGIPQLGFKWITVEGDWDPVQMLPKLSDWLGPFMVDLGWERGLLYFVQIQTNQAPVTPTKPSNSPDKPSEPAKTAPHEPTPNKPVIQAKATDLIEIHTLIPRMEAQIAYDFYIRAHNLSQLKNIDMVTQKFMQSVVLNSLKLYVSENLQECKKISLDCNDHEEEFFDKEGCGCISHPRTEEVYDN